MQNDSHSKSLMTAHSACPRVEAPKHSACPRVGFPTLGLVGLACFLASSGCSLASHGMRSAKNQRLSQSPLSQNACQSEPGAWHPGEAKPRLGLGAEPASYTQQPASIQLPTQHNSPRAFLPAGSYNLAPTSSSSSGPGSSGPRCSCGADHASTSASYLPNGEGPHQMSTTTDRFGSIDPHSEHQPKLRESFVLPGLGSKHTLTPPEPARFHPVPTRPVFEPLAHY